MRIKLSQWARGKYSKGTVKMHTLLDLHGNLPAFISITDGKTHGVNSRDFIEIITHAIYVTDKAYIDFFRLFLLDQANSYFIIRSKDNMVFDIVDTMPVDTENTDVLADQKIQLIGAKSKILHSKFLRRITYYDKEKK